MEILALTLDILGKILVAYTALAVHIRVQRERKMDTSVFRVMEFEKWSGIVGIVLMILGYVLHVVVVGGA